MKPKILKLSSFVLLLLFIGASCQKDEEIPDPIVKLDFKLLNEKGEQSFVFNEGENFTYHFNIETNDTIWKFNQLLKGDTNFFRTYRIVNEELIDVGSPYKSKWCSTIYYGCGHDTPFIFELPWITGIEENEIPNQSIFPPFCLFNKTNYLSPGKYITYFDEQIEFIRCGNPLKDGLFEQFYYTTELMHFEIEFEIK